jgi:hypothetical protein
MDCSKFAPRRLRKFLGLAGPERQLLAQAFAMLVLVRLGLWTIQFRRLQQMIERLGMRQIVRPGGLRFSAVQLSGAVGIAGDYVPGATCLTRALVASALLNREGYPAALRLGVARGIGGKFMAHAWVECDGKVLVGRIDEFEQYAPLPALGAAVTEI